MSSNKPKHQNLEVNYIIIRNLIFSSLLIALVISCNPPARNELNEGGIKFISPTGSPPVDSIAWSPIDTNKILVTSGDVGEGRAQIYLLDIEKRRKDVLAETKYGDLIASWAPDGSAVLLVVGGMTKEYQPNGLWVMNIDDKSLEYIIDSGYAAWSPDGLKIASFSRQDSDNHSHGIKLQLINVEKKEVETIYNNISEEYVFGLSWSADNKKLIFSLGSKTTDSMYVLNLQTKEVIPITRNVKNYWPVWSPIGNIIAYVHWPSSGNKSTLHLMQENGGCDVEIPGIEYVWSPSWSPNGKQLSYIGADGIFIMDVNKVVGRDIYRKLCDTPIT